MAPPISEIEESKNTEIVAVKERIPEHDITTRLFAA
jgi:hypothetical protein